MYITVGRRSSQSLDWCKHEHQTRDEAQHCLIQHQNELRKQGKVSSRQIVETNSIEEFQDEVELY